eukprot:256543-Rhodomonas_salina.1
MGGVDRDGIQAMGAAVTAIDSKVNGLSGDVRELSQCSVLYAISGTDAGCYSADAPPLHQAMLRIEGSISGVLALLNTVTASGDSVTARWRKEDGGNRVGEQLGTSAQVVFYVSSYGPAMRCPTLTYKSCWKQNGIGDTEEKERSRDRGGGGRGGVSAWEEGGGKGGGKEGGHVDSALHSNGHSTVNNGHGEIGNGTSTVGNGRVTGSASSPPEQHHSSSSSSPPSPSSAFISGDSSVHEASIFGVKGGGGGGGGEKKHRDGTSQHLPSTHPYRLPPRTHPYLSTNAHPQASARLTLPFPPPSPPSPHADSPNISPRVISTRIHSPRALSETRIAVNATPNTRISASDARIAALDTPPPR